MKTQLIAIILIALIISACSSTTQAPDPTATPLPTIVPTFTKIPATFTPTPENTSTPEINSNTKPDSSDWKGLPIMPEAENGEPAGLGYLYSVNVTVEAAEQFYIEEMELDGWTLSNRQTSETSMFGSPATILDFQRNDEAVNVMLIFSTNDNYTMVLLSVKP